MVNFTIAIKRPKFISLHGFITLRSSVRASGLFDPIEDAQVGCHLFTFRKPRVQIPAGMIRGSTLVALVSLAWVNNFKKISATKPL